VGLADRVDVKVVGNRVVIDLLAHKLKKSDQAFATLREADSQPPFFRGECQIGMPPVIAKTT
jgi:hypothetical protein